MSDPIATLHHYEIGTTADLTSEQMTHLAKFAEELSREAGGQYHCGVTFGKVGETELPDFRPFTIREVMTSTTNRKERNA